MFDGHAGGRVFTRETSTYASGVAFLNDAKPPTLTFYHNFFASAPLPTGIFSRAGDRELYKTTDPSSGPWGWRNV